MHVRVWSESSQGIGRRLVHRHLGERDLLGALAAQVFVVDAGAARVALGQAGQAVGLVDFST